VGEKGEIEKGGRKKEVPLEHGKFQTFKKKGNVTSTGYKRGGGRGSIALLHGDTIKSHKEGREASRHLTKPPKRAAKKRG